MPHSIGARRTTSSSVVVAIDADPRSAYVLKFAARHALDQRLPLSVVHIVSERLSVAALDVAPYIDEYGPDEALAYILPWVTEALYDSGVDWEVLVEVGDVAAWIARVARSRRASAVVVGAPRRTRRVRLSWAARSVIYQLTYMQSAPILIVPPPDEHLHRCDKPAALED